MMMSAHQKYILPFYTVAIHRTVRAIQGALPRFPRVLLFPAFVSKLTPPWLANMPPMVTEHLSRVAFSGLFSRRRN
jgi:hypothetical protein